MNEKLTGFQNIELPNVYRITDTSCLPAADGNGVEYCVGLYHDKASFTVRYKRTGPDIRVRVGMLATPLWIPGNGAIGKDIQVSQLVVIERPSKVDSILETLPPGWVKERQLIERAKKLIGRFSSDHAFLVSCLFWNLQPRYIGQSSIRKCGGRYACRLWEGYLSQVVELLEWLLGNSGAKNDVGDSTPSITNKGNVTSVYSLHGKNLF